VDAVVVGEQDAHEKKVRRRRGPCPAGVRGGSYARDPSRAYDGPYPCGTVTGEPCPPWERTQRRAAQNHPEPLVRHRGRGGRGLLRLRLCEGLARREPPALPGGQPRARRDGDDRGFEVAGQRFVAINGGPEFTLDEAVSLEISCETQEEVDYFWERLSEGGEQRQCGWLKDRYGLSWQVVPTGMEKVFADSDPQRAQRAMQAMLGMGKLDIAALRRAADGPVT